MCSPRSHSVFAVLVDGRDVGREVRSRFVEPGPSGEEEVILSHTVKRMRLGSVEFDRWEIRTNRFNVSNDLLLHSSHTSMDHVSSKVALVGYDGDGWERLVEKRDSVMDSPRSDPAPLALSGDEVVGFRLTDLLRRAALGKEPPVSRISFYETSLKEPIEVSIGPPRDGSIEINGQTIDGTYVDASRSLGDVVVLRAFFDSTGTLWQESFPRMHEIRQRLSGSLSPSAQTSKLLVGLRSKSYVGLPNSATRAVFRLRSSPDRLDSIEELGVLEAPLNQSLRRVSEGELELEVTAGAPDGEFPPVDDDLSGSRYIHPDAPAIRKALRYLRTAGRSGSLPDERADNATPVIARSSLIRRPAAFWSDPDKVAGIVMSFVHAILPDKRHTFSMSDAVSTLLRGSGDCTEHAVLFASLMRAHGVPTRLVAGIYLTRGGLWGYHMWNAYWNGACWRPIDPGNNVYEPGSLYVALGRGATRFSDLRADLAGFIYRTFSGVSFDLVGAYSDGDRLVLARPRQPGSGDLPDSALFNAIVLAGRGDYDSALEILESGIPPGRRSLRVRLMRIELLVGAGRHLDALEEIRDLRDETSSDENTYLLDRLELESLLTSGRIAEALESLDRLERHLPPGSPTLAVFRSRLELATGDEAAAFALLDASIEDHPDDPLLLTAFAESASESADRPSPEIVSRALARARRAVFLTLAADPDALYALSRAMHLAGLFCAAARVADHALILAPDDRELRLFRERALADRFGQRNRSSAVLE
ncbi:MAG: transglutaminase domain-containing protein [Polyangia bacterium]